MKREIVGVYGTGTIGSGQATLTTGNGYATVIVGHSDNGIDRCRRAIEHNWDDLIAEGMASEENKAAAMSLLTFSKDPEALKNCTFVLEAVSESPAVKQDVYAKVASCCGKDTILASCTSSMDADQLAAYLPDPSRFLIAHPFQPVHLQPLVELVGCSATSPQVLKRAKDLMDSLHRQTVILKRSIPGFIVNRLAQALYRECIDMIEQGVTEPADIDRAVRYAVGMRYASIGLMEYFDAVGYELEAAIAGNIYPTLCNTKDLQQLVTGGIVSGKTGQKAGQGLYTWTAPDLEDFRDRLQRPFFALVKGWDLPTHISSK